jgi:hypothetical protein
MGGMVRILHDERNHQSEPHQENPMLTYYTESSLFSLNFKIMQH